MKIIHQSGYSQEELLLFRLTVYKNVVDSAQAVVLALRKFRLDPMEPVNRVSPLHSSVAALVVILLFLGMHLADPLTGSAGVCRSDSRLPGRP